MADSSAASTASTVSPFLKKTYDILSNPEYEKVCGWGDNNDSVFIKDIDEFAKTVLPKYFKHSNYASFKRQLHKYDFHKTVHNARHGEFKHPYFVRDSPELMVKIQRKIYVKKNVVLVSDVGNTDGETDASSEKGSSKSGQDKDDADFDLDFDFMDDDNNNLFELDFEAFDSVETSVEQGLIEFDNERITVLEKRQADLMDENIATREELKDTLQMNKHISRAMDIMVCATMCTMQKKEAIVCPPCDNGKCVANVDDVCEEFSAQCKMDSLTEEEMEELKNIL